MTGVNKQENHSVIHVDSDEFYYADFLGSELLKRATERGLFDRHYYEAHCGSFESELSAFKDYIAKSHFSNVNPSANFDTEGYMRMNVDVYHSNVSALWHYLAHGEKDCRRTMPAMHRWHPKTSLVAKETAGWNKQKIAICLHIFYPDFVEKFATSLSKFSMQVDVFVTAASDEIAAHVKQRFADISTINNIKVARAKNRGRNFGPFLVEFSQELLEYDLMCHLHSKKSLYSGREQTQWFDYVHEYLLNDRHVTSCLLRLFDEHEDLGIYYPTSFWMMPSWVNHWTCNKPHGKFFAEEWGIDLGPSFINYPASGMFWARPKAIKQLLNKSYHYDDFPEEPLPNDGSFLHALERSIGLLAEKNEYVQFFYHPPTSKFTKDKSYIYSNYNKTLRQFFNEVKNFQTISFDIFDTVLRREYHVSDYAKFKVGEMLTEQGTVSSPEYFIKIRNGIEHTLRVEADFKGDVNILQVYERMSHEFRCELSDALHWADLEFEFDMAQISPKTEMVDIIHRLSEMGRRIWFVTDTYYTERQIAHLLQSIGIVIPHKLFVSTALGKRKDSGTMWQYIRDLVSELNTSYIHIGDNVRSDAQICGDYGLANMHILHPADKWQAAGMPTNDACFDRLNMQDVYKWGPLLSRFGRYPFFGE